MIIEFTGVPGSGKSSIYNQLINNIDLKDKNIIFIKNRFSFSYDLYLGLYFLINFKKTCKYIQLLFIIFKSNNSIFHKINLIRNTIKKIAKYIMYKDKSGIYLFDEGISHIPLNIFIDSSLMTLNDTLINKSIKVLPKADKLIVIEANKELVIERLENRGHKRMNLDDKSKTNIFVNKSFMVKDLIKSFYTDGTLICIPNNEDLSISLKNIEQKLKELNV